MKRYIKTIFTFVLLLSVIWNMTAALYANGIAYSDTNMLLSISNKQLTPEEKSALSNIEAYDDTLKDVDLKDIPIIKLYRVMHWEYAEYSLQSMVELSEKEEKNNFSTDYIVFDRNQPYIASKSNIKDSRYTITKKQIGSYIPVFIKDILDLPDALTSDMGEDVLEIYCFDCTSVLDGVTVYIKTDKGVFIKYYRDYYYAGVTFSEEEFRPLAVAFNKYKGSDENNYDEKGNPLGGTTDFLSFLGKPSPPLSIIPSLDGGQPSEGTSSYETSYVQGNVQTGENDTATENKPEIEVKDTLPQAVGIDISGGISDKKPTTSEQSANVSQASERSNTTIVMFSIGCIAMFALALTISMIAAKGSEKNSDK